MLSTLSMSDRLGAVIIQPLKIQDLQVTSRLKRKSIRVLNAPDYTAEQIEALIGNQRGETNSQEVEIIDRVAQFIENFIDKSNSSDSGTVIARIDDKVVGYAISYIDDLSWLKSSTLLELFVHPDYARRGVGTKLIQTLEAASRHRDCQVISLTASLTGVPFYQACGYCVVAESSYFCRGVRIPVVHMEKWLIEPTEIAKVYWDAAREFSRDIGWFVTETLGFFANTFS